MPKPKHDYEFNDFNCLNQLYQEYLEHRLFADYPHNTFKRYLVSKRKQYFCDLLDDLNKGVVKRPKYSLPTQRTFYFHSIEPQNTIPSWSCNLHAQSLF